MPYLDTDLERRSRFHSARINQGTLPPPLPPPPPPPPLPKLSAGQNQSSEVEDEQLTEDYKFQGMWHVFDQHKEAGVNNVFFYFYESEAFFFLLTLFRSRLFESFTPKSYRGKIRQQRSQVGRHRFHGWDHLHLHGRSSQRCDGAARTSEGRHGF
jgi:hypothetical protein